MGLCEAKCSEVSHCVQFFATPWIVAYKAPLSMEFSRQEYWSGLPFPSPGNLPGPGIKPRSPALLYHLSHQGNPGTLYSQLQQDLDLTVAQIMSSLMRSSGLNSRK